MQAQPILVLKWWGAMAHFRKFYTNSSSLSYAFPPRTVIMGMLSGIVGYERDSYYDRFDPEDFHCAVELVAPVRKISQTVNYIFAKSAKDLNRSSGPTQIPLEIILSRHSKAHGYSRVCYRLFIRHRDLSIMREWQHRAQTGSFYYPPCFGLSEFSSQLEYEAWIDGEKISELPSGTQTEIHSVCSMSGVEPKGLELDLWGTRQYLKERMPRHFSGNRQLKETEQYIFEQNGKSIAGTFRHPVTCIELDGTMKNIIWM